MTNPIKTPVRHVEGSEYIPCGFIEDANGEVVDSDAIVHAINRVAELEAACRAAKQVMLEQHVDLSIDDYATDAVRRFVELTAAIGATDA